MNSSCEAYYAGPGGTNGHGCEQPGTNPAYTVGPEMIYEEKIFVDRCLEMVDDHPSPEVPFFLNCAHPPAQHPSGRPPLTSLLARLYAATPDARWPWSSTSTRVALPAVR